MGKTFKTTKEMLPYLEAVLKRRNVKFYREYSLDEEDETVYINASCSGTFFHKCVVRASVERTVEERGLKGEYWLAKSEYYNPQTLDKVLEELGTDSFNVLGEDD